MTTADAFQVECPTCAAAAFTPCQPLTPRRWSWNHPERAARAQRLARLTRDRNGPPAACPCRDGDLGVHSPTCPHADTRAPGPGVA